MVSKWSEWQQRAKQFLHRESAHSAAAAQSLCPQSILEGYDQVCGHRNRPLAYRVKNWHCLLHGRMAEHTLESAAQRLLQQIDEDLEFTGVRGLSLSRTAVMSA